MWARNIIQMGMRKKVGNGKSIAFFNDLWIPKEITFKPLPVRGLTNQEESKVSEFITPSFGWNMDKIRSVVNEDNARIIATIPISARDEKDKWICHYTSNGEYSVKSGYKIAMRILMGHVSSSFNNQRKWWETL